MFGLLNTIKKRFQKPINVSITDTVPTKETPETLSELTNTLKAQTKKLEAREKEQEAARTALKYIFTSWAKSPE